jgi:hypothetical protein
VNKLDLLRTQVRSLEARLDALEARRARRKRVAAPQASGGIIAEREKLWARYVLLDVAHRGRITRLAFAMRHRLNPTEFCRWFSVADRRGIPEGSGPDLRFRRALTDTIAELEARARGADWQHSHGNMTGSQFSDRRPQ